MLKRYYVDQAGLVNRWPRFRSLLLWCSYRRDFYFQRRVLSIQWEVLPPWSFKLALPSSREE